MLGELQRLCIVLHMHGTNDAHLDFVYAPTDCEFSYMYLCSIILINCTPRNMHSHSVHTILLSLLSCTQA
jgi:hypothetical protein